MGWVGHKTGGQDAMRRRLVQEYRGQGMGPRPVQLQQKRREDQGLFVGVEVVHWL